MEAIKALGISDDLVEVEETFDSESDLEDGDLLNIDNVLVKTLPTFHKLSVFHSFRLKRRGFR